MSVNQAGRAGAKTTAASLKNAFISAVTPLYVVELVLAFTPGKRPGTANPAFFAVILTVIFAAYILRSVRHSESKNAKDITAVVFIFLIIWELAAKTFDILVRVLFPVPENVFAVLTSDWRVMLYGAGSSFLRLSAGMAIAQTFGNVLGLFVGWNKRLRDDVFPIAKVLSPIPPIIYTPYLIGIMPGFTSASIAVIASGLFWPVFMSMIGSVGAMDRRIIDSARAMGVKTLTMLFKVILPCSVPGIIRGLRVQLSTTFMILMMAEMIGAQSGLGYYVKKYSDYANYTNTLAGIIVIGVVITMMNRLLTLVESKTIKWRNI